MDSHPLKVAYESTNFWVYESAANHFCIRCGEVSASLEELLKHMGTHHWAYVTACNPQSTQLSDLENRQRMESLEAVLQSRGLPALHGEGIGTACDWQPEPSFLVLGLTESEALLLGRELEQTAVVVGSQGAVARLLWM
ncbi:MAG: DUF3293 domain-containing protein [Planctomycetota bacterium]